MRDIARGSWLIAALELRQRVRGIAWYVLLGVFVLLLALITFLLWAAFGLAFDVGSPQDSASPGGGIFSTIVYFVLLLGSLVAPALSGNAINGDREAGTLATTQVTLVSAGQIVIGKFLAAWICALAFLAAAVPFLLFAVVWGGVPLPTIGVSLLVLVAELGVVSAIGVGLSGLLPKPLFSIVVSYLVVAALGVGTLIGFGLGGLVFWSDYHSVTVYRVVGPVTPHADPEECAVDQHESRTPRYDYVWGLLAANPYVILADATPTDFDSLGTPRDLFGFVKVGERGAQLAPDLDSVTVYDGCDPSDYPGATIVDPMNGVGPNGVGPTGRGVIDRTVPTWFVGLGIHIVLSAAALLGAWARLRTPARRVGAGSRIA